jgi:D-arabinose 1-dehydrogenase-like Zn-dependent alcohol dehydrogenase
VRACAVCRTDLHVVDGELPGPKLPIVPAHQVVGETDGGRRNLALAPRVPVRTEVERFALEDASDALAALRSGRLRGTAVLVP